MVRPSSGGRGGGGGGLGDDDDDKNLTKKGVRGSEEVYVL